MSETEDSGDDSNGPPSPRSKDTLIRGLLEAVARWKQGGGLKVSLVFWAFESPMSTWG